MGKLELVVVLALGIALLFWLLFRNPPEPVDPRDPSKAQSDGGA